MSKVTIMKETTASVPTLSSMIKPTGTRLSDINKIVINKNVPIPLAHGRARRGPYLAVQLALETMAVGDSFISPIDGKATLSICKSVKVHTKRRFVTRTLSEDDAPVVRVWRIE